MSKLWFLPCSHSTLINHAAVAIHNLECFYVPVWGKQEATIKVGKWMMIHLNEYIPRRSSSYLCFSSHNNSLVDRLLTRFWRHSELKIQAKKQWNYILPSSLKFSRLSRGPFFNFQIKTTYSDISASVVYDVLHDQDYRSLWDKYCLDVKDIGHLNPNNTISYYASKTFEKYQSQQGFEIWSLQLHVRLQWKIVILSSRVHGFKLKVNTLSSTIQSSTRNILQGKALSEQSRT